MAVEGDGAAWPGADHDAALPVCDVFNQQRRYIDVFNRGLGSIDFKAESAAPWIKIDTNSGKVEKDQRIWVSVDWDHAPEGEGAGAVTITGAGATVAVKVRAFRPTEPTRETLKGFVESEGCVAMEAADYTGKATAGGVRWERIDDQGRTGSAMSVFPVTAASVTPPENSPRLEYRMYLFDSGKAEVEAMLSPGLNYAPDRGVRYALSIDDQPPEMVATQRSRRDISWTTACVIGRSRSAMRRGW